MPASIVVDVYVLFKGPLETLINWGELVGIKAGGCV
jgi:hypothetical protein